MGVLQMRPRSSAGYIADRPNRGTKVRRKGAIGSAIGVRQSHCYNLLGRQRRSAVGFTNGMPTALLAFSVTHVVLVRAKEKMSGIHARRIVAAVKDVEIRPFAIEQKPRDTVRAAGRSVPEVHVPIAIAVDCAIPSPALTVRGPGDLLPKSISKGTSRHTTHCVTDEVSNG